MTSLPLWNIMDISDPPAFFHERGDADAVIVSIEVTRTKRAGNIQLAFWRASPPVSTFCRQNAIVILLLPFDWAAA
jgi:hypothetical protein